MGHIWVGRWHLLEEQSKTRSLESSSLYMVLFVFRIQNSLKNKLHTRQSFSPFPRLVNSCTKGPRAKDFMELRRRVKFPEVKDKRRTPPVR